MPTHFHIAGSIQHTKVATRHRSMQFVQQTPWWFLFNCTNCMLRCRDSTLRRCWEYSNVYKCEDTHMVSCEVTYIVEHPLKKCVSIWYFEKSSTMWTFCTLLGIKASVAPRNLRTILFGLDTFLTRYFLSWMFFKDDLCLLVLDIAFELALWCLSHVNGIG